MSTRPTELPPSPTRRGRPPFEKPSSGVRDGKARALLAARALFSERGYADVSMQQIADASGLRKASLYHHFRDKIHLFVEVFLLEMRELRQVLDEVAARDLPLADQIEALAAVQLGQMRGDVERLARDFREHVPESYHEEFHAELIALQEIYARVFRRAAARGELRDVSPEIAAVLFSHMIMAWYVHAAMEPAMSALDADAAARVMADIALHGVAAR